jgi:hypothetical protein
MSGHDSGSVPYERDTEQFAHPLNAEEALGVPDGRNHVLVPRSAGFNAVGPLRAT